MVVCEWNANEKVSKWSEESRRALFAVAHLPPDVDDLLFSVTLDDAEQSRQDAEVTSETPREKRIRLALEEARRSYKAHIDQDTWFYSDKITSLLQDHASPSILLPHPQRRALEQAVRQRLAQDPRGGLKLEWTLSHLYATSEHVKALRLCHAALNVHAISTEPVDLKLDGPSPLLRFRIPREDERTKKKGKTKVKSNGQPDQTDSNISHREVLDIAVRSITKILKGKSPQTGDDAELLGLGRRLVLVTAHEATNAISEFGFDDELCAQCIEKQGFNSAAKNKLWAAQAGLLLSAGDLCYAMGLYSDAIEAYSLVLAARGSSPPIYTTIVRCISSLERPSAALLFLMQACACVALLSSTHTQRKPHLATELEGILQEYQGRLGDEQLFSPAEEDPDAGLVRACHETGQVSLLALVVLVRAALGKRIGGATALAQRVESVISKCKDTSAGGSAHQDADEQNEVKIFKSVRSL